MRQNILDDQTFYDHYRRLRRENRTLNLVLEQPALRGCLPPLRGKTVLDLGCCFGDFCRYAKSQGAERVVGVDLSEKSIAEARKETRDGGVEYLVCAIEEYDFSNTDFDVVVSSLTLNFVEDYRLIVRRIRDHLRPGGYFAFSLPHPIRTSRALGWYKDETGKKLFVPVDHYKEEGVRVAKMFILEKVVIHHRTIETLVNTLLEEGFVLRRLLEPEALPQYVAENPKLLEERRAPPYVVIAAQKA
jgi:2-polyprenyl-3-methyl-5-hydroxy-6-metoxy-1,4-benzoquinol methylase